MQGISVRHNKNGFCICQVHYSANPEKATGEWKERTKRGMPSDSWDQEYEIDFSKELGKRYYSDFSRGTHVRPLLYNYESTLYVGLDYGYHHPCAVFTQMDLQDRWCILKALMGSDITIRKFAPVIIQRINEWFPKAKPTYYGDPAGNQKTDKDEKTTVQILSSEFHIRVQSRPSNYTERKEIIAGKLTTLIDDKPALLINDDPDCEIIIDAFNGGYHYPEQKEGRPEKDVPEKDGYYDHTMNALEYIAVNLFRPFKRTGRVRRSHPQPEYKGWR